MTKTRLILKLFFTSIETWLVFIAVGLMVLGFIQWFQPSLIMQTAALGTGIFLILLWPFIFIKSDEFYREFNQIPDKITIEKLKKLLISCHPKFQEPAMECLVLAQKIQQEFKDQTFQSEVDTLLQNLSELAKNHSELLERSRQFGTPQQQQTMINLLEEQAESVKSSFSALKRFSGNLTLFDLHAKDQKNIGRELQDINLGLQEAIREVKND